MNSLQGTRLDPIARYVVCYSAEQVTMIHHWTKHVTAYTLRAWKEQQNENANKHEYFIKLKFDFRRWTQEVNDTTNTREKHRRKSLILMINEETMKIYRLRSRSPNSKIYLILMELCHLNLELEWMYIISSYR